MNVKPFFAALLAGSFLFAGASAADAAEFGADRHVARGVECASCHGKNNEISTPTIDQCTQCYKPEDVAARTKDVKPHNPHVSPHYGNTLDCTLCHMQHAEPENYCDQCHQFGFKVK